MTRKNLATNLNATSNSKYSVVIPAPGANSLVLAFISSVAQGAGPSVVPTATHNGQSWTVVKTVGIGARRRLTCFRAVAGSPLPGSLVLDFAGQTQLGIA